MFSLIKTKHLYNHGYNMLKLCNVLVTAQFAKTKAVLDIYNHGQNILDKLQISCEKANYGKIIISLFH